MTSLPLFFRLKPKALTKLSKSLISYILWSGEELIKMARQCEVVLSSVLLAAMLFGMTSNFFGHHYMQLIPAAVAQEKENVTNNNNSSNRKEICSWPR